MLPGFVFKKSKPQCRNTAATRPSTTAHLTPHCPRPSHPCLQPLKRYTASDPRHNPTRTRPAVPSLTDRRSRACSSPSPSRTRRRAHAEADPDQSGAWSNPVRPRDTAREPTPTKHPRIPSPINLVAARSSEGETHLARSSAVRRRSPEDCATVRARTAGPLAPLESPLEASLF